MAGKKFKYFLFDVDGTLVDSNDAHAWAWVEAFRRNGFEVTFGDVRKLIGMGPHEIISQFLTSGEAERLGERISQYHKAIFEEEYFPTVSVLGNPRSLFKKLISRGAKIYLASSSYQELIQEYISKAGIKDEVSGYTTADDVQHAKPSPDIICAAMGIFGLERESSIMVGDTPYDVAPAMQLGIPIIAVLSGDYSREELQGAVEIYEDIGDFEQHLESSMAWQ